MNDNSETTIDRKNRQTFKNNYIKESNSLFSSEYDEAEEEIEQMKVDDIMKFCHGYKEVNDENKVKCSF